MLKSILHYTFTFLTLIFSVALGQAQNYNELANFNSAAQSTVVLNNQNQIIPLKNLQLLKLASIHFGSKYAIVFDSILNKFVQASRINGNQYQKNKFFNSLESQVSTYNTVIISLDNSSVLNSETLKFIALLAQRKQVIISLSGDDKNLALLDGLDCPIIFCSLATPESASFTAQLIFGGVTCKNQLASTISKKFIKGMGAYVEKCRFKFTHPEDENMNANNLNPIDAIVAEAIQAKATPGAVVFVAKNGKVIFNKAYGYHTYKNLTPESVADIFDLASVSKLATTTVAMRLYETGKLNLDTVISAYLPETINTNKQNIKVRELLLHQAGLVPFIPFYERLKIGDYSRKPSEYFNVQVADSFYVSKNYFKNTMWPAMLNSPLKNRGTYVYSDLSMYFMQQIIENICQQPLEDYLQAQFFKPLGMCSTGYYPRQQFNKALIVPTEQDTYFRKTLLWGFVHDQGAALLGGVAGHAGLFSNATDLAILFQMMLNGGSYGGMQYLKPETIALFTSKQSAVSRRGLGFDRWDPNLTKEYPSKYASKNTFGHTGYTGTCVWVDAEQNLIYIFLSNRVHPKVNNKISDLKIRTRILDTIYKAIYTSN
ncbi:MAG: beta-N-acetylglucosaminidase [Sphingobacteriales bacterium]|nr:MAG: beta-N-acetylglucosaminidase [Sphingobacteriales bacterium]TAF79365.1 MAG: beta-N-acetylglucosaminidase [Sphingobacteriales bacterium]